MGKRSCVALALVLAGAVGGVTSPAVADVVTTTTVDSTTSSTSASTTSTAEATAPVTAASTATPSTAAVEPQAAASPRAGACPVSALVIVRPGRDPGFLGPIAAGPADAAALSRLRYAADGPVFSGNDVRVFGGGCGKLARVSIDAVSLFGGALVADSISLTAGPRETRSLAGLRVGDSHVPASSKRWLPLQGWGEWRAGSIPVAASPP